MGLFDVNYDNVVWQNLPVRLRQNIHYAWLKCLVTPVRYLNGLFKANRKNNLYILQHDGQVCFLEAALNDTFDLYGRTIQIVDPVYHDPVYVYEALEDKPVFLDMDSEIGTSVIPSPDPVPLYTEAETSLFADCFIVNVSSSISFDTDRMKALIDYFRLPGRNRYSIVLV